LLPACRVAGRFRVQEFAGCTRGRVDLQWTFAEIGEQHELRTVLQLPGDPQAGVAETAHLSPPRRGQPRHDEPVAYLEQLAIEAQPPGVLFLVERGPLQNAAPERFLVDGIWHLVACESRKARELAPAPVP